jgi:hypothetical protein
LGTGYRFVRAGFLLIITLAAGALMVNVVGSTSADRKPGAPAVDLGIGNISGLGQPGISAMLRPAARPGVLVAWRNTRKVLEVETLITNRGRRPGAGRVTVQIVDGQHRLKAQQPPASHPFVVKVPAGADGGNDGITVQVPGTYHLNRLLDGIDRANDPYCIRIRIDTLEVPDGNPLNNVATKCYNQSARVVGGDLGIHQYFLRNTSSRAIDGKLVIAHSPLPKGWTVSASPDEGDKVRLKPGQARAGVVTVHTPSSVRNGDYVDVRPTLVDGSQNVIDGSEFYAAADADAPRITQAMVAPGREPGSVYLVVRGVDRVSGIAEASGAAAEWSTDDGFTMNQRTLTYQDGNFLSPTGFDTDLGPFARGARVRLSITVHDAVGNGARTRTVRFRVPLERVIEFK